MPIAARSGKSGGSLAIHGGIGVSVERMNRILEIRPADLTARVQPGVITGVFQAEVEKHGLFYPPDPNSLDLCTIGGNVAENAGGPRALRYGVTREYVLGLEVVIPTGEILRVGRRTIKGVAGYDLTALFVGSEGTLGIVTEVTVKLLPRPRHVATALVCFPDVATAAQAVSRVLAVGVIPRCLELIDDVSVQAIARGSPFQLPPGAGAALLFETDGNDEEQVFAEMARVAEMVQGSASGEVIVAQNEAQRRDIWETRKYLSVALKTAGREQALRGHRGAPLAHPGDGGAQPGDRKGPRPARRHLRPRRGREPPLQRALRRRSGSGPRPRRPSPTSSGPPWTWAGPSPGSTGWGSPSATSSSTSRERRSSGWSGASRRPSIRSGS